MTPKRFFAVFIVQMAVFVALKFLFFNFFTFENPFYFYLYLFATMLATVVMSRRLGIINYLEAIFICMLWFFSSLLLDLLVTSNYLGSAIFRQKELWLGYLVMLLSLFLFHKKRHVHIRKQHHGHH